MMRGLEHFSCEEKTKRAGVVQSQEYSRETLQQERIPTFFCRACCDNRKGNGLKLKEGRFRLDIKKKLLTASEGGEALEQGAQRGRRCPNPGTFKARLEGALNHLV